MHATHTCASSIYWYCFSDFNESQDSTTDSASTSSCSVSSRKRKLPADDEYLTGVARIIKDSNEQLLKGFGSIMTAMVAQLQSQPPMFPHPPTMYPPYPHPQPSTSAQPAITHTYPQPPTTHTHPQTQPPPHKPTHNHPLQTQ